MGFLGLSLVTIRVIIGYHSLSFDDMQWLTYLYNSFLTAIKVAFLRANKLGFSWRFLGVFLAFSWRFLGVFLAFSGIVWAVICKYFVFGHLEYILKTRYPTQ